MRNLLLFCTWCCAIGLVTLPVGAQVPATQPTESPSVVPPRPLSIGVDYPPDASGDAIVSLSFVVQPDGSVEDPEVAIGDEPFASAAIEASKRWRFEPALVAGQPVAARISMEVRFTERSQAPKRGEPTREPEPTTPDSPETPETPPPKVEPTKSAVATMEASADVLVEGERPPGTTSFSRAEARQVPGAFGDPLRSVEMMPGVGTMISGLPLFYVRGAPPGNVGYFIDEIRLPFLFHAFLGPSVVHPELLDRVNLHASWYPANYGNFTGGAVVGELRAPRHEQSLSGGLSLWEAGAFAESSFAGDRGNIAVGGRYAFTGLVLSALTSNTIEYWNYQTLAHYELGPQDNLRVFVFGAFDYLEDPEAEFLGNEFHRVDVRYDHHFSPTTTAYAGVTLGYDRARFSSARVADKMVNGRVRVLHQASKDVLLRVGANVETDFYDLALVGNPRNIHDIEDLFPARQDLVLGGFTDLTWTPRPGITLIPGVRTDVYRSGEDSAVGVDPRIAARFNLAPGIDAVHTAGLSHQVPNYVPNVPGARVGGIDGGRLQKSLYATAGAEVALPKDFTGVATVFDSVYFDLTDPYSLSRDLRIDATLAKRRMMGHSYGLEVELRRPLTRRFGAMLSYTLSRSTRSFDTIHTLSGYDRTHVLNLAGMYTLGPNWRLSARSLLYSGLTGLQFDEPRMLEDRSAPFFRLDLRLERRFQLGPRSWWSVVAEVLNATGSKETIQRVCNVTCEDDLAGPIILPNVKVEAQF